MSLLTIFKRKPEEREREDRAVARLSAIFKKSNVYEVNIKIKPVKSAYSSESPITAEITFIADGNYSVHRIRASTIADAIEATQATIEGLDQ